MYKYRYQYGNRQINIDRSHFLLSVSKKKIKDYTNVLCGYKDRVVPCEPQTCVSHLVSFSIPFHMVVMSLFLTTIVSPSVNSLFIYFYYL